MIVESVTTVETLPGSQSEVPEFQIKQQPEAQVKMEVAIGVQAVTRQASARTARVKEVRARFDAGTYRQDSRAIAQKMLEIE